jgi:hypothetical protein
VVRELLEVRGDAAMDENETESDLTPEDFTSSMAASIGSMHRGPLPVIKLSNLKRDMFAADKDRGDRAAWKASGSNRTFEDWKADRDAEALRLAQDKHAAMAAEADAARLAVEAQKAEAEARKAERALACYPVA